MRADIHNHTCHFSPDAKMTIDQLIKASVDKGLSVVGITEHFEYDNPDPEDEITTFDLDEYAKAFDSWRSSCPPELKLLRGIEFGYQPHTAGIIDDLAGKIPLDVVILSLHLFGDRDIYYGRCYDIDKITRHTEYISRMAQMCEACSNYDIAGHFDYINRYNPDIDEYIDYMDCPDEFDRLFDVLIRKDKALEINTRSILKLYQKGASRIMPDSHIIRRYIEMGGRLIALGSDSHTSDTLGVFFDETCEYLKSLGVTELCYFADRQPVLYPI